MLLIEYRNLSGRIVGALHWDAEGQAIGGYEPRKTDRIANTTVRWSNASQWLSVADGPWGLRFEGDHHPDIIFCMINGYGLLPAEVLREDAGEPEGLLPDGSPNMVAPRRGRPR